MRRNETKTIGQLFSNINKVDHLNKHGLIQPVSIKKEELWKVFKVVFQGMLGKSFIENETTIGNIKILFFYFLNDPQFFNCKNLVKGINKPSFNKGLLIIGGVGIGKTDYLKVFEKVFMQFTPLRFKMYSSTSLVKEYEKCSGPTDKDYFFKDKERKRLCIDDMGAENNASNFGLYDVVGNVITNRYDKKLITHGTTNFASSSNNVEETLQALGGRYGHRVYDRLYEMFNVIVFEGLSLRA